MTDQHLAQYPLSAEGAIRNWLACGPLTSLLNELHRAVRPDGSPFGKGGRWILNYWAFEPASAALKLRVYHQLPPLEWKPGARPVVNSPGISGKQWEYTVAEEDEVIDFSRFNFTPNLMQGWVFACLEAAEPVTVQAELLTIGPARVWLNNALQLHYAEYFSYVATQTVPLTLTLSPGLNDLYLHGQMLGWREARLALGLRFPENPPITISLPLGEVPVEQWHRAENGLSRLLVKQFAFPEMPGSVWLDPTAPESFAFEVKVSVPLPENVSAELAAPTLPKGHARLSLKPGEAGELPITPNVLQAMAGGKHAVAFTASGRWHAPGHAPGNLGQR